MNRAARLIFFAILLLASAARAEQYSSLVDRGEFFLGKGAAYLPDAVRALEQAAAEDEAKAAKDARFVALIVKAYMGTSRLTEAYHIIEKFDRAGGSDKKVEGMRDYLLKDAGAGRFRLAAMLPASGITGEFRLAAEGRLDAASRKIMEKLNQYLAKPFSIGRDGLTLLVPEGEFVFRCSAPMGTEDQHEEPVEIIAGIEMEQMVVAPYPTPDLVRVLPGNRSLAFEWPKIEKAGTFNLVRFARGKEPVQVYSGKENSFSDTKLPPGEPIKYRLLTYGPEGALWGAAQMEAASLAPVSSIAAKAHLGADLMIILDWEAGEGSIDRLIIRKIEHGESRVVIDQRGEEIMRTGQIVDGPVTPTPSSNPVKYQVEALMDQGEVAASAVAQVVIPPEVGRIEGVREQFTPDRVFVEWDTAPRDGIAEGYRVFLLKEPRGPAELVGTVREAHARDFSYVPKRAEPLPQAKHMVIPYVGKRFLVEPVPIEAEDKIPEVELERRYKRFKKLPNLILSWEPYPGTPRYLVRVAGRKEFIVKETYVEITGLQASLEEAAGDVKVFAFGGDGTHIEILSVNIQYLKYMGGKSGEEEK